MKLKESENSLCSIIEILNKNEQEEEINAYISS